MTSPGPLPKWKTLRIRGELFQSFGTRRGMTWDGVCDYVDLRPCTDGARAMADDWWDNSRFPLVRFLEEAD